jgi:DNA transformation protein
MSRDQLAAHAVDLLSLLGPGVAAKRMFGGLGLYAGGCFIGIGDPDDGRLYLRVDDASRATFLEAGGQPFTYGTRAGAKMVMDNYLTPPDGALDDAESMLPWARLALEAARRHGAAKAARSAAKKPRGAAKRAKAAAEPKPTARPKPAAKAKSSPAPKARAAATSRARPAAPSRSGAGRSGSRSARGRRPGGR